MGAVAVVAGSVLAISFPAFGQHQFNRLMGGTIAGNREYRIEDL